MFGRAAQGLELEGHAHLVEVVDLVDGGGDGPVAPLGVGPDQSLGVEPEQRLPDRGAGHTQERRQPLLPEAQVQGKVAHEQAPLELVVGVLAAQDARTPVCIHPGIHPGRSVRRPDCRPISGDLRSGVAYLALR